MIRRQRRALRQFSTVASKSVEHFTNEAYSSGHRVFVSGFHDPFLNIAMEDYLFHNMPVSGESNRLLLYVNNPCVVIGRNQNPWRECNVPLIKTLGVPLVRRRSGGGAVVHDTENVNFSVMTKREDFTRDQHAQMIVDCVNDLPAKVQKLLKPTAEFDDDPLHIFGTAPQRSPFSDVEVPPAGIPILVNGPQIKLKLNHRYDIVDAETERKVSGSAYKIARQRAYHHGTLLLNSRLDVLKALLARDPDRMGQIQGRGVESVKSPVANVGLDKEVFIDAVIRVFIKKYQGKAVKAVQAEVVNNPLTAGLFDELPGPDIPVMTVQEAHVPEKVVQAARDLESWAWAFGQTPDFTHTITIESEFGIFSDNVLQFTVSKGLVRGVELLDNDRELVDVDSGLARLQCLLHDGATVRYTSQDLEAHMENEAVKDAVQSALDTSASLPRPLYYS